MHVRIKFCGLTRARDVEEAESLGAEYLGVIFAGGPRNQSLAQASALLRHAGAAKRVGVFGGQRATELHHYVSSVPLAIAQLHGETTVKQVLAARATSVHEVWAVVPVSGSQLSAEAEELFRTADAVVLDTRAANGLGGSGKSFDWMAIAGKLGSVNRTARLVIAGGLSDRNVAEAIRILKPDVVDVSSGVESAPGAKDPILMRRFTEAVRSA